MTPQPGTAEKTNEPDKEADAVPITTESATGQNAATGGEDIDDAENATDVGKHADDTSADGAGTRSAHVPSCDSDDDQDDETNDLARPKCAISFSRIFAFGVLPFLALLLAGAAGCLKWQSTSIHASQISSLESVAAAKDTTIAMLSYQPDTVEKDLGASRDRLTGTFKDSYTQLIHDVVIPGAKQRHISAIATVPAASSVSATENHAVALVFVNQTVTVGTDPPSATASSVRVTMSKIGDRWLISGFDPV